MNKIILTSLPLMFALTACVNGQHTDSPKQDKNPTKYTSYQEKKFNLTAQPTVKTDRYTLVELDDPIHKYVLDQIIDIAIPKNVDLSVKDGMNYVLKQSGYTLYQDEGINVLYQSTLPKVHYKMGPIMLGHALQIMAGPAWKLVIDDVERKICFELADGYHKKVTSAPTVTPLNSPLPSVKKDVKPITINQEKMTPKVIIREKHIEADSEPDNQTKQQQLSQFEILSQIKKLEPKDDCKE